MKIFFVLSAIATVVLILLLRDKKIEIHPPSTCWMSGLKCPHCGGDIATNGEYSWCVSCGI